MKTGEQITNVQEATESEIFAAIRKSLQAELLRQTLFFGQADISDRPVLDTDFQLTSPGLVIQVQSEQVHSTHQWCENQTEFRLRESINQPLITVVPKDQPHTPPKLLSKCNN